MSRFEILNCSTICGLTLLSLQWHQSRPVQRGMHLSGDALHGHLLPGGVDARIRVCVASCCSRQPPIRASLGEGHPQGPHRDERELHYLIICDWFVTLIFSQHRHPLSVAEFIAGSLCFYPQNRFSLQDMLYCRWLCVAERLEKPANLGTHFDFADKETTGESHKCHT